MKTLTLLRHAKSGWDDPALRDVERPLNPKGHRAAAAMGRYLRRERLTFDHVAASTAVRVRETLDAVAAASGLAFDPVWDRRLYLAEPETLVTLARGFPAGAARALLVGHNPGLEELVLLLAQDDMLRDTVEEKYPTGSLAELTFAVDDWQALATGGARLTRFVRPRDLDPALGPDGT